ncbi:M28 family peptidase [Novosphingobium rosa]|uniref:M28 family peptidase n=1 Tax=Novosphingobium rosa TaxID=76978 RepID=UPI000AF46E53|nr:M28 family peptidase [Novosphingobium rosa]
MTTFRSALRSLALVSVASLALAAPVAAHDDDDALDIAGMTLGMGPQAPAKEAPVSMAGPTIAEAALPLDPRFSPARIQADVTFFADDLLLGRDTGSQGHEIAARYVAARFTGLGLTPMGDTTEKGRSWLQRITFQKTTRADGPSGVDFTGANGKPVTFAQGKDALVGISVTESKLDVSAPLVFVGYGLENSQYGLDDYKGLDVKGKIVVLLSGFPSGLPSEEAAHIGATKGEAAAAHGAIGIITIGTNASLKVRPWERSLQYAGTPRFNWVDTTGPNAGKAHDNATGLRASASIDNEAATALLAGAPQSLPQIRALADKPWIGGKPVAVKGFALKGSARIYGNFASTRVTSPNVAGMIPGSDPALKDQYVVLSGHLDHLGVDAPKPGEPADKDRIYNGALDNAAGTSTLLEVAHVMAQEAKQGKGPRRSVIFLVSTGEEKGLLGADFFARHPAVPVEKIVGNVDLDMPVLLYPFTDLVAFGADHSTLGKIVANSGKAMQLSLSPDPMPTENIFVRSDHYMFVKQGVPAVFLATGYGNGGAAQWTQFMKTTYHKPGDDLSQPINWRAGARFAEANWRITSAMADSDTPPLWYKGDFFGNLFAPKAARAEK